MSQVSVQARGNELSQLRCRPLRMRLGRPAARPSRGAVAVRVDSSCVVAWENAPVTNFAAMLAEHNVILFSADRLSDVQLTQNLWRILRTLAMYDVHLCHTDHLSNRELYQLLVGRLLWQPWRWMPPGSGWRTVLCALDAVDDPALANQLYARHYASDVERLLWYSNDDVP